MYCKNCGTKLNTNEKFCHSCGNPTEEHLSTTTKSLKQKTKNTFLKPWLYSTFIITILFTVLFALVGSFDEEFWGPFIGTIFLASLISVIIVKVIQWREKRFTYEKEKALNEEEIKKYKGIDGWLGIVVLGLILTTGYQIYSAFDTVNLITDNTFNYLIDASSPLYISGYNGLLKFEFITTILLAFAGVYLIFLFFRKNKKFPKYYIIFLVSMAAITGIIYFLLSSLSVPSEVQEVFDGILSNAGTEVTRGFLGALIWGAYMLKSKRVKATFVN